MRLHHLLAEEAAAGLTDGSAQVPARPRVAYGAATESACARPRSTQSPGQCLAVWPREGLGKEQMTDESGRWSEEAEWTDSVGGAQRLSVCMPMWMSRMFNGEAFLTVKRARAPPLGCPSPTLPPARPRLSQTAQRAVRKHAPRTPRRTSPAPLPRLTWTARGRALGGSSRPHVTTVSPWPRGVSVQWLLGDFGPFHHRTAAVRLTRSGGATSSRNPAQPLQPGSSLLSTGAASTAREQGRLG